MMTGSRAGNALFLKLVREMGGAGTLPDAPPAARLAPRDEALDVCVVGGGPAGLAAARAIAEAAPGARVALYDEQAAPGGSLLAEPGGAARAAALAEAARGARRAARRARDGHRLLPRGRGARRRARAPGGGGRRSAAARAGAPVPLRDRRLRSEPALRRQRSPRASISARACGRLAFHWGVRPVPPKRTVIILDGAPTAAPLERALNAAGRRARSASISRARRVVGARGTKRVRGLEVAARRTGPRGSVDGDLVAVATLPSPASELPRQHGAAVALRPARGGFAAVVDAQRRHDGRRRLRLRRRHRLRRPRGGRARRARRSGARWPRRWARR